MGCRLSCYGCSSYSTKISKRIRTQRELADLFNDIFEREDRFIGLCSKIENIQERRKLTEDKKSRCIVEEQRKTDYETKLKKILERRKELLLKVISAGIALQDRERELLAIDHRYAKIWSLTFEDDPEDKLEEWKRDLCKTHSQGDVSKVVTRPPVVTQHKYVPVFLASYSKGDRKQAVNQMLLP